MPSNKPSTGVGIEERISKTRPIAPLNLKMEPIGWPRLILQGPLNRSVTALTGSIGLDDQGHFQCFSCEARLIQVSDEYWAGCTRWQCPSCGSFIILEGKNG